MMCGVLEAAKAVDVPSVSIVVATAIKTKIDIFLAVVLMLTPRAQIFVIRDWFTLIITRSIAILSSIFDE
jgi:hypothetical protein